MATHTMSLIESIKKLTIEHFTTPATKACFEACNEMFSEGEAVDETTLAARIAVHHRASLRDCVEGLTESSTLMLSEYIEILNDRLLRRMVRASAEAMADATTSVNKIGDVISSLESYAFEIRDSYSGRSRKTRFSTAELSSWFEAYLDTNYAEESEYCFSHALPSLQQKLGSYSRGEFGIVAGYSSDGKSVYGLQLAEASARQGYSVGYYSLEMPERQVYRRLASMGGVPLGIIKHRKWDEDQLRILQERQEEIKSWDMDVLSSSITVDQIRADQMRHGYDIIIIDHLHRMPNSEDRIQLEKYVRACKTLALDANCAVVALAQLSRREGFPPPTTNQLRGTDVLTQEPDWCVFMYRERDEEGRRLLTGQAIVGKNRDGESDGVFPIRLDANDMKFKDIMSGYGETVMDRRTIAEESRINLISHPSQLAMEGK